MHCWLQKYHVRIRTLGSSLVSIYLSIYLSCFFFQLTVADLTLRGYLEFLGLQFLFDKFPKVAASCKKVEENKNIAKWLKERPDNVFHPDFGL